MQPKPGNLPEIDDTNRPYQLCLNWKSNKDANCLYLHGIEHMKKVVAVLKDDSKEMTEIKGFRYRFGEPSAMFYFNRSDLLFFAVEEYDPRQDVQFKIETNHDISR